MDEVVRCVMWHRIALPFGINQTLSYIDTMLLYDYWVIRNDETWMKDYPKGYKAPGKHLPLLPVDWINHQWY